MSIPRPWRRRARATALAVLLAVACAPAHTAVAAPGARAQGTWHSGSCAGAEGVTVVVDFGTAASEPGTLAGTTVTRCALEPVTSGFDALTRADIPFEVTTQFPGLLCRIDGRPADLGCYRAPPADRYWAYWTADAPGGGWHYADEGAGTRDPAAGAVDGWAFSDGCTRPPGASTACASSTTTTTSAPPTTTTVGGDGTGTVGGAPPPTGATGGAAVAPGQAATSTTGATQAAGGSTTTAPGERAPRAGAQHDEQAMDGSARTGAARTAERDAGSPLGLGVALAVLVGAAVAAWRTARRRGPERIEA